MMQPASTSSQNIPANQEALAPGYVALHRITRTFTTAISLDELLLLALGELTQFFGLPHGTVLLIDDVGQTARLAGEFPPRIASPHIFSVADDHQIAALRDSRQPIVVSDPAAISADEPLHRLFNKRKPHALLLLPLFAQDRMIGVVGMDSDDASRTFSHDELVLGGILASQLALAISTLSLYETVRRRSEELAALNDIATTVTSSLDPREVYKQIVRKLNEYFRVEAGSILLLDEQTNELVFVMTIEAGEEKLAGVRVPPGQGVVGHVAKTQQPIIVPDAQNDPRFYKKISDDVGFVTRSILCVPMLVKGHTIGVIELLNKLNGEFTEEDAEHLNAMAKTIAVAIDNARLFQEVAQGHNRLEALLNSTEDGFLMIETSGLVAIANPVIERFFGLPWHELPGTPGAQVMREIKRRSRPVTGLRRGSAEGSTTIESSEYEVIEPEQRFIRQITLPVQSKEGLTIGQLVVFHDITEQYELEQLREDYTGMVVHDLRSPLTSILNGITMVQRETVGPISDTQRELLEIAASGGRAMLALINTLLDISKMESGEIQLTRAPAQLDEVVDEALERVVASARNAEIQIYNKMPSGLPQVEIDKEKMVRVLQNLLDNAIKFTPARGRIHITAQLDKKEPPTSVILSVRDTGPGIPKEYRRRIFEKFGQVQGQKVKGTGLGLAFCKLAVEAHGGAIWVEGKEGKGSTFAFRLPLRA